jgi:hypothetical protein
MSISGIRLPRGLTRARLLDDRALIAAALDFASAARRQVELVICVAAQGPGAYGRLRPRMARLVGMLATASASHTRCLRQRSTRAPNEL